MRIFLIGFNDGLARSLARYVGNHPHAALGGCAPTLARAGTLLPLATAALVLIEWSALGAAAADGLRGLRRGRPRLRLVCVVDEAAAYREVASAAGADAVISKAGFAEELEAQLRCFFDAGTGALPGTPA